MTQNELTFETSPPRREQHHTQRRNTYLRDYEIGIKAHIELSPKAEPGVDTLRKFNDMFEQRIRRGQQFRQIYFGIRECMACVELIEGPLPRPIPITQNLGIVYYGMDFDDAETPRYFAPMEMRNGIVQYPTWDQVRQLGISAPVSRGKHG